MSVFGAYSRYYDLLYRDKDYAAEVQYASDLLRRHAHDHARSLLDVGCGTGRHGLLFLRQGFEVDGVDRSPEMIQAARERAAGAQGVQFHVGDARALRLHKTFDVAVSLFHVMSYQTSNDALEASFKSVYDHLKDGGVFLFDFWYGPGVLGDKPTRRVKEMEDAATRVRRVATPVLDSLRNVVEVHYDIAVEDKTTGHVEQLAETHNMRFLFKPELDYMLGRVGFRTAAFLGWMSDAPPEPSAWNACVVAIR